MRITKHHAEIIVNRALVSSFKKTEESIVKEENELAIKAYNSLFDTGLRRKAGALPEGWLRRCDCLSFTVNGQYHNLKSLKPMPTPYSNGCGKLGNLKGEIADEVITFANKKEDLKKEKESARIKLYGMLSNISTFKKLDELWPEGKTFFQDLDEDAKIKGGLPAIRFDELNAILGLKKSV